MSQSKQTQRTRSDPDELVVPAVSGDALHRIVDEVFISADVACILESFDESDFTRCAEHISGEMQSLADHFIAGEDAASDMWEPAPWVEQGAWRCRVEDIDPWVGRLADVIDEDVLECERPREAVCRAARRMIVLSFVCCEHDRTAASYVIAFAE